MTQEFWFLCPEFFLLEIPAAYLLFRTGAFFFGSVAVFARHVNLHTAASTRYRRVVRVTGRMVRRVLISHRKDTPETVQFRAIIRKNAMLFFAAAVIVLVAGFAAHAAHGFRNCPAPHS